MKKKKNSVPPPKKRDWKKVCCQPHNERQLQFAPPQQNRKAFVVKTTFQDNKYH